MNLFRRFRRSEGGTPTCAEVAVLLQQYLDGELGENAEPLVRAHLEQCERCGLEASVLRDVKAALAAQMTPSTSAVSRTMAFAERVAHGEDPSLGVDHDGSP